MRIPGGHHKSRRTALATAALCSFFLVLTLASLNGAQAADTSPIPTPAKSDSEVVVMLDLDGESLAESFVVNEQSGNLSVPVCALAEVLSLAINCQDKRAYGFILEESRPFAIDLEEGYAVSGRNVFRIKDACFFQNGDLFVDIRELSKWLPIDFTFKVESSTLHMHAREVLPLQGFKKRQRSIRTRPLTVPKHYDDFTPARVAASVPTVDLASQVILSGKEHAATHSTIRNSVDISGDLLYMSNETHFFAENESLKRLDVTLYRRSADIFKIGPLAVTQVAIGAAQAPYVDGIGASTKPMYGLYLSNRPISGASKFLSHDVNGYLPQGWDAELFHNGTQIGYQPPTQEGMYHFVNLRVFYGINDFKVILHGPFGERRESDEVFISDAITPTGEFFYTLSAGWQPGWTQTDDTTGLSRESNMTLTSDFGISKELTGSALLVRHTDFLGAEQDYAGVGIRTAIRYTLLSLDLIQSFSPGDGRNGQLLTAKSSSRDVFGLNLEVVQRFFHNFDSPQFLKTDDPLVTRTSVKANSSFTLLEDVRIPYSVEIGANTMRSGEAEATSEWRISGGWNGWNGTLETDISYLQRTVYAACLLQISTRLKDISVRGQAGISLAPTATPSSINLSADKDLGNGLQFNSGFSYDPVSDISGLRLGISKRLGLLGYSISATGSTNGVYGIDVGVRTSLAADRSNRQGIISAEPLSPYGMIAVSAASPEPGGSFGKPLPGIGFLVNGNRATTIAGTKGWPVIAYLQPDFPVDVTVDLTTVEDPFMVPIEDGCHIIPRAGVVSACKFTMTTGGEIDGMVLVKSGKSEEVPLKGVRVDLMVEGARGAKLQASTRSEESGYYLFKAVKPGSYKLVIPDAEIDRLKAAAASPIAVTMPVGGDMVSGKDFFLGSATGEKKEVAGTKGQ
jgi:hypothetical protein